MNKNEKGQALIEFILFVPFLVTTYFIVGSFGNAINGSINQQKAVRNYFYYKAQNDSTLPKKVLGQNPHEGWMRFGMYFLGWQERSDGQTPVAPCYKLNLPLGSGGDNCEDSYTKNTTQFIRVMSVYGVCGNTYIRTDSGYEMAPAQDSRDVVDAGSCTIQ